MSRPLILGFIKARNEIVREGNIYRAISNMRRFCDTIVACDDASNDGTREFLQNEIPADQLVLVPPGEQDFGKELFWKQKMLEICHRIKPHWIWWQDADEELEAAASDGVLRSFCTNALHRPEPAWRFHYTQLWRVDSWARTDDGFDDGYYIKLWKWDPKLSFEVREGTHFYQFPKQIEAQMDKVGLAPWEIIHWGNWGKNLVFKSIQYAGQDGAERHLEFDNASYRPVIGKQATFPFAFTAKEKDRIRWMHNLKERPETFTVVISTYNRAATLPRALRSLQAQSYDKWVAVVVDDGSTDDTEKIMRHWQETDPRIFYCRFPENRGGVAANEVGMALASEWSSWWTRLGSDDWFENHKLELDAAALKQHRACYGPYRVFRDEKLPVLCNPPMSPEHIRSQLLTKKAFQVSWSNCAAHTSMLREIRARHGNFCSPELRNMEDFHVNSRIVRITDLVWRGRQRGRPQIMVNPDEQQIKNLTSQLENLEHDAIWRIAADGASSNAHQTDNENQITKRLIDEENVQWAAQG